MRTLRCWPILIAWASLACGGCFGGFHQPPQTGPKKETRKSAAASQPAPDAKKPAQPEQTYAEAWRLICEAERRAGVDPALDRAARGAAVADWIVQQLKNKKARYWFIGFGKVKQDRRGTFLAEAKRAGLPACALAELLFDTPTSAPAP